MRIILGVSGSIAAYKAVDLLRFLQEKNNQVTVVMTENAKKFVTSLCFETFALENVFSEMFSRQHPLLHIKLATENDLLLIAPATANIIAKFASGIADDLLTTIFVAFSGPVFIAPAMHPDMYANKILQLNLKKLQDSGVKIIEPETGRLDCGAVGKGKMASFEKIYQEISQLCSQK